jgi:hypothetical protein
VIDTQDIARDIPNKTDYELFSYVVLTILVQKANASVQALSFQNHKVATLLNSHKKEILETLRVWRNWLEHYKGVAPKKVLPFRQAFMIIVGQFASGMTALEGNAADDTLLGLCEEVRKMAFAFPDPEFVPQYLNVVSSAAMVFSRVYFLFYLGSLKL